MKILFLLLAGIYNSGADYNVSLSPTASIHPTAVIQPPAAMPTQPLSNALTQPINLSIKPTIVDNTAMTLPESIFNHRGMKQVSVDQMTQEEKQSYIAVYKFYANEYAMQMHAAWYEKNGFDGGDGSGSAFILMHRAILKEIQSIFGPTFKMPILKPEKPIPLEFSYGIDPEPERRFSAIPGYLTLEGGNLPGSYFHFSLDGIDTLDNLGRLLKMLDREWHMALGADMRKIRESIANPLFGPLHYTLNLIVDQWLQTESGQIWHQKNLDHAIFRPLERPESYSNERFAQKDGCHFMGALCRELASIEPKGKPQVILNLPLRQSFSFSFNPLPLNSRSFRPGQRILRGI